MGKGDKVFDEAHKILCMCETNKLYLDYVASKPPECKYIASPNHNVSGIQIL